ncbi:nucleolar protein 9 [Schistocerca piceifrons]|uniref:nucleolar protein 9 n=1 Tax=Schistocerca piceifrons TaxID=274613 RepID=UPI001F5F07AE|nr:nucleolar protein 9 [Schistocerca piceifrons]
MDNKTRGFKRKKKSFLKNARKYGKKGKFGRGSHINEETYQYFLRVLELDKSGFDNAEEKKIFVENVFQQTVGEELNYSYNQVASRALENILPFSSDDVINRFIKEFDKEIRVVCVDQFASHVLQKLITVAADRNLREPGGERLWLTKVALFVLNNIEEFVWDQYANHIVRTVIQQLGTHANNHEELKKVLVRYSRVLAGLPQLRDFAGSTLPSGLLQVSLQALGEHSKPLIERLLADVFRDERAEDSESEVPTELSCEASCRLAEAIVATVAAHHPSLLTTVRNQLSHGRVALLSLHPTANFFVQRLLQNCWVPSELEKIFDELSGRLSEVLSARHSGVLLSLGQACQRLGIQQHRFMKELFQCFECWEPDDRQIKSVWQIATLKKFSENDSEQKVKVQLHGSLLLQALLSFKKPIKIVQSLLQMPVSNLTYLICDPCGSHIMDAFVNSPTVGEKSREKMAHRLKGNFVTLSCSKHGSRALDALWAVLPCKLREMIATELSNSRSKVIADNFGFGVWSRYALDTFCHRRADWVAAQEGKRRVQKLFADILPANSKSVQ